MSLAAVLNLKRNKKAPNLNLVKPWVSFQKSKIQSRLFHSHLNTLALLSYDLVGFELHSFCQVILLTL